MKKYELEFSTDGTSWQPYQEGGAKKVNLCSLLVRRVRGREPGRIWAGGVRSERGKGGRWEFYKDGRRDLSGTNYATMLNITQSKKG